ncbi:hypothetical protein B0H11DRAFT_2216790 [Mycena galericulata]|nr:hypothetical protein B0H11DRAFT_2216790 [Mycena galericulata]
MTHISETSLSLIASALPASTTDKSILIGVLLVVAGSEILHYASPMRLTRILVAAIGHAEETYTKAMEAGVLSDVHIETLLNLQIKVSEIRQESLHNSLSPRLALWKYVQGRTLSVLHCISEVRKLETDIEILKEAQLRRDIPLTSGTTAAVTVSLRRRLRPNHSLTPSY